MEESGPSTQWIEAYRRLLQQSTRIYAPVFSETIERCKAGVQQLDKGEIDQSSELRQWWGLAFKWWESTLELLASPLDTASTGAVPSVLFVVHPPPGPPEAPTAHDPIRVVLRAALDPTTVVRASPLLRIDAPSAPPVENVITLERKGRQLDIGLQDLIALGSNARGHHVASVYADEIGNKIPLAVVNVVFAGT